MLILVEPTRSTNIITSDIWNLRVSKKILTTKKKGVAVTRAYHIAIIYNKIISFNTTSIHKTGKSSFIPSAYLLCASKVVRSNGWNHRMIRHVPPWMVLWRRLRKPNVTCIACQMAFLQRFYQGKEYRRSYLVQN